MPELLAQRSRGRLARGSGTETPPRRHEGVATVHFALPREPETGVPDRHWRSWRSVALDAKEPGKEAKPEAQSVALWGLPVAFLHTRDASQRQVRRRRAADIRPLFSPSSFPWRPNWALLRSKSHTAVKHPCCSLLHRESPATGHSLVSCQHFNTAA